MTDPFLPGTHSAEKEPHVRMKNTAVWWLMTQGFDLVDIEEEVTYGNGRGNPGYLDVVAHEDDGSLVIVECETRETLAPTSIGQGAGKALREGHQVFILNPTGLYEVLDRRGGWFKPIDTQLSLTPTSGPRTGRWFDNGREKQEIEFSEHHRNW